MAMVSQFTTQKPFITWMKGCHQIAGGKEVAIDYKTVCGSYNKSEERSAIHMVNAFATEQGFCLE